MPDREDFNPINLGIQHTELITTNDMIASGESFLNGEPEDVEFIDPKKKDKPKDPEEKKDEKVEVKQPEVAKAPNLTADDLFDPSEDEDEIEKQPEEDQVVGEKKKKAPKQDASPVINEEDTETNQYSVIAKTLLEQGILLQDEDEDGNPVDSEITTPEELLKKFALDKQRAANDIIENFLGQFGPDYRDMFFNVFQQGVSPVDYLSRYTKIEQIGSIDLADEGNQERVVRELYKQQGRTAEKIEEKIQKLKNYGDLATEAEESKEILIKKETDSLAKLAEDKKIQLEKAQERKNQYTNSMVKILNEKLKAKDFDGIPVDKPFADSIYAYLTQDKFKTPDNQLLTEFDKDILDLNRPEHHELKVKVSMLMKMAKADPQLSTFKKKAVSKETNVLFSGLKKNEEVKKNVASNSKKAKDEPIPWF